MTAIEPVLRLIIHGTPATAGSKSGFAIYKGSGADRRFTGRVTVTETTSPAKKGWSTVVRESSLAAITCGCGDPGCTDMRPGFPLDEALSVSMVFTVPATASMPRRRTWPSKRPDLLKYARATEDHMTAAGVFKDDARIVEYLRMAKVYPGQDRDALPVPGAQILIWRTQQLDRPQLRDSDLMVAGSLFDQEFTT